MINLNSETFPIAPIAREICYAIQTTAVAIRKTTEVAARGTTALATIEGELKNDIDMSILDTLKTPLIIAGIVALCYAYAFEKNNTSGIKTPKKLYYEDDEPAFKKNNTFLNNNAFTEPTVIDITALSGREENTRMELFQGDVSSNEGEKSIRLAPSRTGPSIT